MPFLPSTLTSFEVFHSHVDCHNSMVTFIKNKLFTFFTSSLSNRSSMSSSTPYRPLEDQTRPFLNKAYDVERSERFAQDTGCNHGRQSPESCSRINPRIISDAIIGMSDGLTVPFALTAGLSALGHTHVVIYGGLAELIAGSISMGLGGYLGAKSEAESYYATKVDTQRKIVGNIDQVQDDVCNIFQDIGIPVSLADQVASCLVNDEDKLVEFMMRFDHSLPEPPANRNFTCALTIALGYFIGGFIPLFPYFFVPNVHTGLLWSAGVMAVTLFSFGYAKTAVVHGWVGWRKGWKAAKGGIEMVLIGSVAAGAAMGLVYAFN